MSEKLQSLMRGRNITVRSYKQYKCRNCGHEQQIQTNHYGACFSHCHECSWKGTWGEHPGAVMFGTWHRPFDCAKEETAN